LVVDVYQQLREDIYDRRLAPAERPRPVNLGQHFQVSGDVIREALGLLATSGLARLERNGGSHVVTLSRSSPAHRVWSGAGGETSRDIGGEHRALLEAALAHDAERAVAVFDDDLNKTMHLVMELEAGRARATTAAAS
jgi:DNA-binding GntR family transcriptional regulator